MKKLLALLILLSIPISLCGCTYIFIMTVVDGAINGFENPIVKKSTEDPADYGCYDECVSAPAYLPNSLDGYTVNAFSYSVDSWNDYYTSYEIFLDITVSEEEFTKIINAVNADERTKSSTNAFYGEGFSEIVFSDTFITEYGYSIGPSNIEKVIYNSETHEIAFAVLFVGENALRQVSSIAYFKRFNITEQEYLRHQSVQI